LIDHLLLHLWLGLHHWLSIGLRSVGWLGLGIRLSSIRWLWLRVGLSISGLGLLAVIAAISLLSGWLSLGIDHLRLLLGNRWSGRVLWSDCHWLVSSRLDHGGLLRHWLWLRLLDRDLVNDLLLCRLSGHWSRASLHQVNDLSDSEALLLFHLKLLLNLLCVVGLVLGSHLLKQRVALALALKSLGVELLDLGI